MVALYHIVQFFVSYRQSQFVVLLFVSNIHHELIPGLISQRSQLAFVQAAARLCFVVLTKPIHPALKIFDINFFPGNLSHCLVVVAAQEGIRAQQIASNHKKN
ncbi:hypothetical protein D3C86_1786650 [compost metagenome]